MNKKLLCTAIGASLAATAGIAQAANQWEAHYALVPYVVKDANRTTVVSVILAQDIPTKGQTLHLQYQTKSTTDASTAACRPSSVTIPVTPNDIVTFDTAGILGYPLFGDTTNPAPLGVSIAYAAPQHGYLWIEAVEDSGSSEAINGAFWLELDLANGGAHGETAPLVPYRTNLTWRASGIGDYLSDNWVLQPDRDNGASAPVVFWPSSVAATVFTVTPLGSDMQNRENNQVIMQVYNTNDVQGAYDRNENGVDGAVPVTVRCVGRVTPAQLMPGIVANAAWAAQGGWGWLANRGDGANVSEGNQDDQGGTNMGDLDAIVYQVDTSSASGKFMSNASRLSSDLN